MVDRPDHRPFDAEAWALFAVMSVVWGVPYLWIKVAVEHVEPPVVVFGRSAFEGWVMVG